MLQRYRIKVEIVPTCDLNSYQFFDCLISKSPLQHVASNYKVCNILTSNSKTVVTFLFKGTRPPGHFQAGSTAPHHGPPVFVNAFPEGWNLDFMVQNSKGIYIYILPGCCYLFDIISIDRSLANICGFVVIFFVNSGCLLSCNCLFIRWRHTL